MLAYFWSLFGYTIDKTDEKILAMINSEVIVPISDDFLLYHKDSETT